MQRMKHLTNYQLYPLLTTWLGIRQRCFDPTCGAFEAYGGRGITMCDRWAESVDAFVADMGPRPAGLSIDRIDVNGHYEPNNCRWATREQQARNKRTTRLTDADVEEIVEAMRSGVPASHITLCYPLTASYARLLARGERRIVDGLAYSPSAPRPHAKKLTLEDAAALRAAHAAGAKVKDLAVRFDIHRNNVHRVLNGTSWVQTTDKHPASSK